MCLFSLEVEVHCLFLLLGGEGVKSKTKKSGEVQFFAQVYFYTTYPAFYPNTYNKC